MASTPELRISVEKLNNTPNVSHEAILHFSPLESGEESSDSFYPTGLRLSIMVFSLVISIFLISLDMASNQSSPQFYNEALTVSPRLL